MKSDNALCALHHALTRARCIAYTQADAKLAGKILDDVEYLTTIILRRDEYSEEEYQADFRLHLQDIGEKFSGFTGLVQAYDEGQTTATKAGTWG